jgi:glycosyltransferase involved in cell wall biosynthesis
MHGTTLPLVLHVLPLDLARGAQRYARAMRDALDGRSHRHRIVTLFRSEHRLLDADIKLEHSPMAGSVLGLDPRVVLSLRATLRRHEPALVVAHGSQPLKYLAAACSSRRLVYYKIGISTAKGSRGVRRHFHTLLLARARRVAGVSQDCLDEARDVFGVSSDKLVLIPNGRDPSTFTPGPQPHDGSPVLTFVGHLTRSKRPERFLALVQRLRAEGLPFRARMVGGGPMFETLRQAASQADVELLGQRDDVPELLRSSDILVFTSIPDNEGMPGVFIEAGMSGLPVVTTDVPGARSVILDGETGFVVAVEDQESLAARTRELLTNPELRRQMGAMARQRCASELSLERSAERWHDLITELLSAQSARTKTTETTARG